jgi:hypothetical protein
MTTTDIDTTITALGITYQATFRPTPQAGEKYPQLHWLITLGKGNQRMTCDYHQGIAHVEGYQNHSFGRKTLEWQEQENRYRKTCETGHIFDKWGSITGKQPAPKLADVLYCLVLDSDVLDYSSYEEWAPEMGYDMDSRKGEEIYRLCLKQSLAFRNLIGNDVLEQLRKAFQDY